MGKLVTVTKDPIKGYDRFSYILPQIRKDKWGITSRDETPHIENYCPIGHIVGLDINSHYETIIKVQFQYGVIFALHPAYLEELL